MAETNGASGVVVDNYIKVATGPLPDLLLLFASGDHVNADAHYRRAAERVADLRRTGFEHVRLSVYRKVARWPEVPVVGEWRCYRCAKGPNDCRCGKEEAKAP